MGRDAANERKRRSEPKVKPFPCLCNESIDKIPHYMRDENTELFKSVALGTLNMWRLRLLAHYQTCENRELDRLRVPERATLIDRLAKLSAGSINKKRQPACLPDERRMRKRHKMSKKWPITSSMCLLSVTVKSS